MNVARFKTRSVVLGCVAATAGLGLVVAVFLTYSYIHQIRKTANLPSDDNKKEDDRPEDSLFEPVESEAVVVTASSSSSDSFVTAATSSRDADDAVKAVVAVPSENSLPLTLTRSYRINSIETDAWIQVFSDRIFLGVSQMKGKIANLLLCQADPSEVDPKMVEYHVTTLLGNREDPMLEVYARRITEEIFTLLSSSRESRNDLTIVLGISLDQGKVRDPDIFRAIVSLLVGLYRETV